MKRLQWIIAALLLVTTVGAQQPEITLEDIWKKYTFYPGAISEIRSMEDGKHFTVLSNNAIDKFSYKTGEKKETVLNGNELRDEKGKKIIIGDYYFSKGEKKVIIATQIKAVYRHSQKAFFYIYDFSDASLIPLSEAEKGMQRLAAFAPDGSMVAFVRENNIFIKDLEKNREIQVTKDGAEGKIINGTCDWVYEEEFGFTDGFKWSPDSRYIAFYRFDESNVKEFQLEYYGALYPYIYKYKYPKAGEDNSVVTIHAYDVKKRKTKIMDTGKERDIYIPRIKWAEKNAGLAILRLNRLQNHLEILLATPKTGKSRIVYEEKNKYYIDITDNLFFLDDGFVITSEKSGYNHIYYHSLTTENNIAITSGKYDVSEIYGVDKSNGLVYYEAAASNPMNREVYSVGIDGTGQKSIAVKAGHNSASFSETYDYFILKWSDANTPPVYSLMDINGNLIKIMESNANLVKMQQEAKFPLITFDYFTTDEGVTLNYWMIKPNDFDPLKKYPVLMYVYGGPGSQTVENLWSYQNLWHIYMAKKGYIVVSVDNRGTGNRGEEFKKCTYKELGKLETIDQISTAEHLASVSYIDPSRIGIWGWSYGGYMTTLCMTKGADIFKTGVAVAPVTNWRYYDNIYTERFMRTPQENGENYDINSPVHHVDSLKGKYMVIHGAADDNVHVQNTYDLVNALIKAGKQFDMFIYPNRNHGIYGGNTRFHLYNMMTNYILENL